MPHGRRRRAYPRHWTICKPLAALWCLNREPHCTDIITRDDMSEIAQHRCWRGITRYLCVTFGFYRPILSSWRSTNISNARNMEKHKENLRLSNG